VNGTVIIAIAGAFGTGVALPICVFHYQRFWENCQKGSDVARKLVRSLEELRDLVSGYGPAATSCGRPELYRSLVATAPKTKEARFLEEAMFDLHDDALEKSIRKTIFDLRAYVAFGTTDLMQQTDMANDWNVSGSPVHVAWSTYVHRAGTIHLPALERSLAALRPLTSPWGLWIRPAARFWIRGIGAARRVSQPTNAAPAPLTPRRWRTRLQAQA
jgi:hypothetical protein